MTKSAVTDFFLLALDHYFSVSVLLLFLCIEYVAESSVILECSAFVHWRITLDISFQSTFLLNKEKSSLADNHADCVPHLNLGIRCHEMWL
jgi:hypothetical protein